MTTQLSLLARQPVCTVCGGTQGHTGARANYRCGQCGAGFVDRVEAAELEAIRRKKRR